MKCYYCEKECEGFVFEQGNFSVFAHKECAVEKVEKDGNLKKDGKGEGKMFKAIMYRYGSRVIDEFDSFEEAKDFGEEVSDMGEAFFECIVDENDIILYDGKTTVIGIDHNSEVGKLYKYD